MFFKFMLIFCSIKMSIEGKVVFNNKIVGGQPVNISQVPFQLSLHNNGFVICGASLISSKIALTAGHCVYNDNTLLPAKQFVVFGGSRYVTSNTSSRIVNIKPHPNYNYLNLKNDIAVLKLKTALQLNGNVNIIKLPNPNFEVPDGSYVTVSGWGFTEESGKQSSVLLIVDVLTVNHKACSSAYSFYNEVTDTMICAGVSDGGKDSCSGDSGGPLVYKNTLVGIVSWGYRCAAKEYPGVYTKVSRFINFINNAKFYN